MKKPEWRLIANRANAQHSTGPKTPEGKAISSRNSTSHGLTSKQVVIAGEDAAEYDTHRADLITALKPADAVEAGLVEELAANSWRLKRAHRFETAILNEIAAGSPDPDAAIAKSFLQQPKELERLIRYMTSIERAYWKVFNKLETLQRARREQEYEQEIERAYNRTLEQARRPQQLPANGFVLQSSGAEMGAPLAPPPLEVKIAAAGAGLGRS